MKISQDEQLLQSSLFSFWFSARPPKAGSNVCVDRQSSSSLLGLFFQLYITVRQHPTSIICLGFFVLFPSIFPSITIPMAVSLLLACVRSISFVCFLLFVSGIFPLQLLPALLRFLYVLSSCFSVFFSTIALQKLQVILYPLIS